MADFEIDEEIMSRIEADSEGSSEEETPIISPKVVDNEVASDTALDDGIMARIEADTNRENAPLMTTAKDPMQAAREYHAAKRLGRSPVEVEADLDDIERAEKEEQIGRQLKGAPHTAAWMAENGDSSSALVDKVKDLSRIENLMPLDVSAAAEMQARNEGEEWEFLADLITSTKMNNAQFEMGILYNTLESAEDITPDFKAKVAAITKRIDSYRDQLYDENGFGSNAGMVLASLPLVRYGGEGATYGAALAALSLAGSAMATAAAPVTGGATLPVAAALGSFATMTASGAIIDSTNRVEQGMQLKNMLDEGVPFEDAMIASQVVGAVNAGLELAGASIVGKTLKPLVRPIMSKVSPAVFGTVKSINPALKQRTIRGAVAATGLAYGKGIAGEVSTEVMQEVASIIADDYGRIVTGKELLSTQEIIDRLADTAIATAKGMMVMGSFGGLALLNHNIRQVHKAEDDKAKLLKMARSVESINKEPLTAEVAKDVVQHQAERKGTPTIYVQASAFEEAMTSEGVELSDLDEIVPGLTQEKLEQLKAQGEDVEIETGAYAQKVIGTTFGDRLADDIRTSKDGISVREAQKVRAESAAILKDLASGKVDEAELDKKIAGIDNPEIKEKTNTLAKRIEAKLKETGVYGAEVARTNAKYAAWLVSNLARRSGLSFERVAQLAPNVTHAVTQATYANALKEIREVGQGSADGYIRSLEKKRSMLDENQIKALEEFKEVYARYRNTEQWMKSPNGNSTNLNEVQWVIVRTPSFKAWFGDWEKSIAAIRLLGQSPITIEPLKEIKTPKERKKKAVELAPVDTPVQTVIGIVHITKTGIRKSFGHKASQEKLDVIPRIEELLEKATYLGSLADFDGKAIENNYFATRIRHKGQEKVVFMRARKFVGRENHLYVHDIFFEDEIKNQNLVANKGEHQLDAGLLRGSDLYKAILQSIYNFSESSLGVVDENGEPKVEMRTVNGNEIPVFVNGESIISATDNIGTFDQQNNDIYEQAVNKGYVGYSMSVRAMAAYANGEKPLSKWKKKDIVDEYTRLYGEDFPELVEAIKAEPIAKLKLVALKRSSWHHTSSKFNRTDFYSVREIFDKEDADALVKELAEKTPEAEKTVPKQRLVRVEWLEFPNRGKPWKVSDYGIIEGDWFKGKKGKKKVSGNYFKVLDEFRDGNDFSFLSNMLEEKIQLSEDNLQLLKSGVESLRSELSEAEESRQRRIPYVEKAKSSLQEAQKSGDETRIRNARNALKGQLKGLEQKERRVAFLKDELESKITIAEQEESRLSEMRGALSKARAAKDNLDKLLSLANENVYKQNHIAARLDLAEGYENWKPTPSKGGGYKGGPEWVRNAANLGKMRKVLRQLVMEGISGRFWYEDSAKEVWEIVGHDFKRADMFCQLLAIYSPRSNIWVNSLQAVRAYTHWASGMPAESFDVGSGDQDSKAIAVLYKGEDWDGRKTGSFYTNLMYELIKGREDEAKALGIDVDDIRSGRSTTDMWVMRAFGYANEETRDDKGSGMYSFTENETRRLTAILNEKLKPGEEPWTPHQVQAAMWTALKTRYEIDEVKAKTNKKSTEEGILRKKRVNGKEEYDYEGQTPDERRQHHANWREFAMEPDSATVTKLAKEMGRDFSDELIRQTQTVTAEAIPSYALGQEINDASEAVRRMFTDEAMKVFVDGNGKNLIAEALGIPLNYSSASNGAYDASVSPNQLLNIIPFRPKDVKAGKDQVVWEAPEGFDRTRVRMYARVLQYIFKQDAVPFFRLENKPLVKNEAQAQKFRVINANGRAVRTFETESEARAFMAKQPKKQYTLRGGKLAKAFVIRFDHELSSENLKVILDKIAVALGESRIGEKNPAGFTQTDRNEITVVNFRDDDTGIPRNWSDEDFVKAIHSLDLTDDGAASWFEAWSDGEYGYRHDWGADPDGSRVLQLIGESRGDIVRDIRTAETTGDGRVQASSTRKTGPSDEQLARWRADYEGLLRKYSGESLQRIEREAAALQPQIDRQVKPTGIYQQRAFHGSPFTFDKFTLEHIGSGEGAQAHGWGLYFALSNDTAAKYWGRGDRTAKVTISDPSGTLYQGRVDRITNFHEGRDSSPVATVFEYSTGNIEDEDEGVMTLPVEWLEENFDVYVSDHEDAYGSDAVVTAAIDWINNWRKNPVPITEEIVLNKGSVYEVEIPEDDVMLREEKLLKDQPQKVQAGIRATIQDIIERYPEAAKAFGDIDEFFKTSTGKNLYSVIKSATGSTPEGASRLLNEHGIKGIRYRGEEDGECAVVFDDKSIRILQYFQTAFHGSPYQFERFDSDRIGTGMGATRFGWGIYFAGDRDVAQAYASRFADNNEERIHRILMATGEESKEDLYGMSNRDALRASVYALLDAGYSESTFDAVEAFFADKDAFYATKWLDDQTREFIDEITQEELGKPLSELSAEEFKENLDYWMSSYVLDGVSADKIGFLEDVARNGFTERNLSSGFVYEASIPDDDVILDQDLPLDRQPEKVKAALRDYLKTDDLSSKNGYAFYRYLCDKMLKDGSEDPEKDASLLLNSMGIRGMRFTKEHGSPCYVVFDDEAIEVLNYRERLVEAGLDGGFRGAYNPSTNTVNLTDDADLSTFAHELGHWYLDTIIALSQEAGVSDGIKEDVATLMNQFGVADVNAWKSLSFEERERFHEQFAAWVETYLAEGKAPTLDTKKIFSRFGEWIRNVYRAFTGGAAEGVKERYRQQFGIELPELSDEVRRVLDRMVASEEDIETAQAVNGLLPLFMDKPEGMSDEAWNELQEELDTARNDAIEALTRIRARDERWYTKARAVKLAEIQAQAREIRDVVRAKVEEEVNNTPSVRALNWLMANDKAEKGSQFRTRFKFSLESLKAIKCSERQISGLRRLGLVLNNGGTDIATIRSMLQGIANFESDKDLVTALISASNKDEIIERRTTERCLIEHSDFFDSAKVDAIVTQALHSEARSRVLAHELAWLNNDTPNRSRLYVAAAKEAARQMVGNDRITKVNVKRYLALQTRWARAAREALARGDRRAALQAKRLELVAHEAAKLVIEIDKLKRRVDDIRSRIFGNDKKLAKTYDIDIIHALRFILNANGLGPSKSKTYNIADAIKHIERMQAYSPDVYQRLLPLIVNYGVGEANVRELTTAQVRELFEVVASLYKMARDAKSVLLEGKRLSKEEIVSELVTQLASTKQKPYAPGTERVVSDKERAVYAMLNVKTALIRVENWCNAMDGGRIYGPFKRYIFNPVSKSVAVFKVENNKLQKRLYDLIAPMQKQWSQVRDIKADELGYTFATKEELIAALLHTGNDSNKRKLLLGGRGPNAPWGRSIKLADGTDVLDTSNWDAFIARCIRDGIITKEDMDFVQAVWDTLESTKPMAQKAFKAIYGYYFDEVEATPVQTPWGEYRGGYVPAITTKILDPNQGQHEELKDVLDEDTVINAMPVVRPGFTQKREEAYHQPLDLNVGILCGHVQGVVKFAILAPTCMEVAKILNDRAFGDAVAAVNPHIVPHLLTPWLKRAYTQSMGTASGWIGTALSKLRSLAGMGIMMGHIANGLQQLTGFSVALKEVDGKNLLRAFAQFGTERGSLAMRVKELSPFMKSRLDNFEYEYQSRVERIAQTNEGFLQAKGVFNKVAAADRKLDKIRDWVSRHSYFVQVGIQYPIDIVVWTAAFNEALEKGVSEADAIAHADFVVRTTQSDFAPENVANVETGHPGFRLFLVFYNYFGMQLNALAESHEIARQKKQYGKFLADAVFVLWIPSVLAAVTSQLVTGFDTGDDDDWDIYDFFRLLIGEPFKNVIAMMPYLGSFANTAGASYAKKGDPVARFIWGDDPFVGKPLGSPGLEVVYGASDLLEDLYDYAQDKDVNARSAARHFTDLMALITRVPVGAFKKPLGYLAGVANDEIEVPSSPIQATREFIAGRQIE